MSASALASATGLCDHCKLPLPRPRWERTEAAGPCTHPGEPAYCCFGCRFAAAVSLERSSEGTPQATLTRLGLAIFFTMNVMAFTMALWTTDVYQADATGASPLAVSLDGLFRHLVMLFALPVLLLLGWPLLESALEGLGRGVLSTDLLLALGVAASFAYSVVSVVRGAGSIYFEVGCVVLVMVTLGRWLEATGKLKANDALDRLARLLPEQVRRIRDGIEESAALAEVGRGDRLRVLAGERVPADGRLERGLAFVDEQVLTGESRPALKQPGDPILGGTLNLDGDLVVEVAATGAEATLSRLIELVRRSRAVKGHYERMADRVSAWLFPVLGAIALATFAAHAWIGGLERGLLQGLAVLLIACPCALGLATPLAVWTALGRAAGEQVLFRSAESFERLASIEAVRFDKTGTLTTGTPTVARYSSAEADERQVMRRARALGSASSHVLARAILRFAGDGESLRHEAVSDVRSIPGRGVVGRVGDAREPSALGSRRLMEELGLVLDPALEEGARQAEAEGRSLALVGWEGRARGLFVLDEQLRPSARPAVALCRALGLDLAVLTGDHAARGRALAEQIGVPVEAGLLPEGKVAALCSARARLGPVAMVGDGVNDAPALAASDLGVAMGCGTDLSRESAAVCLLGDDLTRLPWAIDLARRTVGVVRGNLAWAFGYNSLGVLCAALGWLNPAMAALLMVGSSIFVITNSLRLRDAVPVPRPAEPEVPNLAATGPGREERVLEGACP